MSLIKKTTEGIVQQDPVMIGEEYINQVRQFGVLGYTPERIVAMLSLTGKRKEMLITRISIPGDTYHTAYQYGHSVGEYNIDAELTKKAEKGDTEAITILEQRTNYRIELDLRKELFGI